MKSPLLALNIISNSRELKIRELDFHPSTYLACAISANRFDRKVFLFVSMVPEPILELQFGLSAQIIGPVVLQHHCVPIWCHK